MKAGYFFKLSRFSDSKKTIILRLNSTFPHLYNYYYYNCEPIDINLVELSSLSVCIHVLRHT